MHRFATIVLILLVAQSTQHGVVLAETSNLRRAAATAQHPQYQRQLTASSWMGKLYNQVTCTSKKQQNGKCSKSKNDSSKKDDYYEEGYAEGYQDGHSDGDDSEDEQDHYENGYSSGYQDGYADGGDSKGEEGDVDDSGNVGDNEAEESDGDETSESSYLVANSNATEDEGDQNNLGWLGVGLFVAGVAGVAAYMHKQRRQKQYTQQGTELGNYVAPKAQAVVGQPVIRPQAAQSKVNIRVDTFKQAVEYDTNGNFELALLWYKEGLQQSTGLDTIIADASGKSMLDIYSNRVAELEMS